MTENKKKSPAKSAKTDATSERQARLNEALRKNLKKRKAQARARNSPPKPPQTA